MKDRIRRWLGKPDAPQPAPLDPWSVPHREIATAEDIFYCFRLILGRTPNPPEWPGHSSRVGEDLSGVVASYVRSLEFARRGLLDRDKLSGIELADLPSFRIYVSRDDAAVGRYVQDNTYEHDVTAVFQRVLRPGMGVIDIGANIGYFTMLSAAAVGKSGFVLAIEPNPSNARLLEASRRANGFDQVVLSQTAAGSQTGLLVLNTSHSNGTTSAPSEDLNLLLGAETVPCVRVDALVPEDQRIGLIKIDVEGAEYNALRGCEATIRRDRPVLISEFSPDFMAGISGIDGETYLRWIIEHGYELSVIQPDGSQDPMGTESGRVMAAYHTRGTDHIDIVGTPL